MAQFGLLSAGGRRMTSPPCFWSGCGCWPAASWTWRTNLPDKHSAATSTATGVRQCRNIYVRRTSTPIAAAPTVRRSSMPPSPTAWPNSTAAASTAAPCSTPRAGWTTHSVTPCRRGLIPPPSGSGARPAGPLSCNSGVTRQLHDRSHSALNGGLHKYRSAPAD